MTANQSARKKWEARLLSPHEVADYVVDIRQLTRDEQERQAGELIGGIDLDGYLDKILAKADFAVLNAEGKCCGFCAFYTYEPALDAAFITLFLLAPEVRRNGMARGVLEVVAKSALQHGFRYLTLRVRQNNFLAIRFYLGQGFRIVRRHDRNIEMTLEMTVLDSPRRSKGATQAFMDMQYKNYN
ncbi:MAG TPA: GNAT family N-acetyltransferase [Halomonas sp.]|nr:GNAT family N-acetyltransferase [Halomonas sp.]